MMIYIIVPFENSQTETALWAKEEQEVDFRRDPHRATRCTTAFAATELKHYLSRTLIQAEFQFASHCPKEEFFIDLRVRDFGSKNEAFVMEPCERGIVITGYGRTGVLYGAYELLRMQGWRWFAPGAEGEIAPSLRETLVLPQKRIECKPAMDLGRGFEFEGLSKDSTALHLWMARNKLNLSGYRSATGPLGEKLGMSSKIGGHIFEEILHPDRVMPSGKTLWEEHQDWFGLPADGVRKKEEAQRIQFCVAQPELTRFLAEELLVFLMGQWKAADRIDIWTFDTWGSTCQCEGCKKVGNSSDQLLYFLSELRTHLNLARKEGRLDHDVRMVGCAYEGTCTLEGPQHPIPQNLIDAGDYLIYAPIIRCYAHDFGDANCSWNAGYTQTLGSWLKHSPSVGMMIDEYYNVSKFEDLPILFTNRITADLPFYHAMGVRGMTYMHVPMTNWAMRSLTQILYAELCWNIHADVHSILKAYFHLQYGPYSETMRRVYALLEEAWLTSAQWRAWRKSILNDLLVWDGAKPVKPFLPNDHFSDTQDIINNGRRSISLMQEAMKLLNDARKIEQTTAAMQADLVAAQAVNPVQAREHEKAARYENRLGEDRRLMTYGLDTLTIMTELVCYYEALRVDDQTQAEIHWGAIESVAEKLDGYFVPMTFDWPGPGFECRDGLTRSQVREVLRRCRKYRLMINGKS